MAKAYIYICIYMWLYKITFIAVRLQHIISRCVLINENFQQKIPERFKSQSTWVIQDLLQVFELIIFSFQAHVQYSLFICYFSLTFYAKTTPFFSTYHVKSSELISSQFINMSIWILAWYYYMFYENITKFWSPNLKNKFPLNEK